MLQIGWKNRMIFALMLAMMWVLNVLPMVCLNLPLNGLVLKVLNYCKLFCSKFENFKFLGNVIEGQVLNVAKIRRAGIETYECIADNGIGDTLRKTITINFSGKNCLMFTSWVNRWIIPNQICSKMWRLCSHFWHIFCYYLRFNLQKKKSYSFWYTSIDIKMRNHCISSIFVFILIFNPTFSNGKYRFKSFELKWIKTKTFA